jgi:hypothetical protein
MILNAGNGKFIGGLLLMASLMYGFLPIDLSHLTSTLGRDETVFNGFILCMSESKSQVSLIAYITKI